MEKTLMLGKTEGRRRRQQQRMRWLDGITNSLDMNLSKFQKVVEDREVWCAAVHGVKESDMTEQLNNSQVEDAVLFPKQGSDSPNRDQIPQTRIKFMTPAVEPCRLNHWTAREVPLYGF